MLAKQAHEHPAGPGIVLVGQQAQTQAITAEEIAHGQRLLALAIDRAKPALEIHGPDLIGPPGRCQSGGRQDRPWVRTTAAGTHALVALQAALDRTHTRQTAAREKLAQPLMDFLGTPVRPKASPMKDALDPGSCQPPGRTGRSSGLIGQAGRALSPEASEPFVSRLATDAATADQRLQRVLASQNRFDQFLARPNQREDFPRHDRRKPANLPKTVTHVLSSSCRPCLVTVPIDCPDQNGDVESANGHLKQRLTQHLLLRGYRDFAAVEA